MTNLPTSRTITQTEVDARMGERLPIQPTESPFDYEPIPLKIVGKVRCKTCCGQGLCMACNAGQEIKAERDAANAQNKALRAVLVAKDAECEEMRKVLGECVSVLEWARPYAPPELIQRIKALTEGTG